MDSDSMKSLRLILFGIILGLISTALILLITRRPHGTPIELQPIPTPGPITVDVSGSVLKPGVYTLPLGSRVMDVVNLAGGLRSDADGSQINLAARLRDEQKLIIPAIGTPSSTANIESKNRTLSQSTLSPGFPIDINLATSEQLQLIPGIGPTRAKDILAYRDKIGKFKKIEDLLDVPGIGSQTLETIKPYIMIDPDL